jgi:hypothetical protein
MDARGYYNKQKGDACEMLVAAELTLAGVPALRVPDLWPGYDVIAHPPDRASQRVSVKSRTAGNVRFVGFDPATCDWLAIVLFLSRSTDASSSCLRRSLTKIRTSRQAPQGCAVSPQHREASRGAIEVRRQFQAIQRTIPVQSGRLKSDGTACKRSIGCNSAFRWASALFRQSQTTRGVQQKYRPSSRPVPPKRGWRLAESRSDPELKSRFYGGICGNVVDT